MTTLLLRDPDGSNLTSKEKTLYVLTALFFCTLFLPGMPVINNVFIGLIFIYSFIYNSIPEKIALLKQRTAVKLMLLFYLLHIVSALFSANKQEAIRLLGLRIPLLMFPIAVGLIYIQQKLKERLLLLFAFIITAVALLCLVSAFIAYYRTQNAGLLYNDSLTDLVNIQSIYFALMVNIAIFAYVYLLVNHSTAIHNKWLAYLSIIFLSGIDFMLASRIVIINLCVSLLLFAFVHFLQKRKFLEGATLIMGLLVGGFLLVKVFPKTINRFRELVYTDYKYNSHAVESHYNMEVTKDQWNGANIRLAVWSCGWELAKQNPVFGAGLGDKKDRLMQIYKARHFDFALQTERNMHNNYLDVLCTFGVTGLLLFLFAYFGMPVISIFRSGDALGICIVAAFAFSLVTETYLDRSLGSVLFGFFMSFVAGYRRPHKDY
jgi:O-antigen ligase